MYRCQLCGGVSPAGVRAVKVVVATRPKQYPFRRDANWLRVFKPKSQKWEWDTTDDPGGAGFEIVQEVAACPPCAGSKQESPPVATGGLSGEEIRG